MTVTVWKKVLEVSSFQGEVCVWYSCDPEAPLEKRGIFIYGTGHPIDNVEMRHLGSAFQANGNLVWHVFERL